MQEHKNLLDAMPIVCAGVAGLAALTLSDWVAVVAGLASILLVAIRVYDRIKYGPPRSD